MIKIINNNAYRKFNGPSSRTYTKLHGYMS